VPNDWQIHSKLRRRENKTLVKILGGRQHRTTLAGQILEGRDPCNPCGVDAYGQARFDASVASLQKDLHVSVSAAFNEAIATRNGMSRVSHSHSFPEGVILNPKLSVLELHFQNCMDFCLEMSAFCVVVHCALVFPKSTFLATAIQAVSFCALRARLSFHSSDTAFSFFSVFNTF